MRVYLLLLLLFGGFQNCLAQFFTHNSRKLLFGIHANSVLEVPLFCSLYFLNSKNKGLGVKFGYGLSNEKGKFYYQDKAGFKFGEIDYFHKANYFYVTPQILPYTKTTSNSLMMFALGFPIGLSENKLTQKFLYDPVFGDFTKTIKELNIYGGLEIELSYWRKIGKKMALKYGATTGVKLFGKAPFQPVFENFNRDNTYYPGLYKTSYFDIHIGLLYSHFSHEKKY
jgi:hypothetical protein